MADITDSKVYFITMAVDEDDAKINVSSWIEDYEGRESFGSGELAEESNENLPLCCHVSKVRGYLEKQKEIVPSAIQGLREGIKEFEALPEEEQEKRRGEEGYIHKRLGCILQEEPCEEMPFFNIEMWDWSLPAEAPEKDYRYWYAVLVDLHF